MKVYNKRIAFVIHSKLTAPAGGVGQFVKGFLDMAQVLNWKVDIITDKEPRNKQMFNIFRKLGANIITPDNITLNKEHTDFFTFGDSYDLTTITNVKNALYKALQTNHYDCILHNSLEFILATHSLGLQTPTIVYTHQPETVFLSQSNLNPNTFINNYYEMYFCMCNIKNIIMGTQSQRNVNELTERGYNAISLPLPLPEQALVEPYYGSTNGVLFIGRWEDRKNPKAFINLIRDTNLPAKVMTSPKGVDKFRRELDAIGATYDIRANIMHQEKVDFIRSSRVMFMPSNKESYGLAMLECMGHCPVVVHEGYDWVNNFNNKYFFKSNKNNQAKIVLDLYNRPYDKTAALEYVKEENNKAYIAWSDMFEKHPYFIKEPLSPNKNKISECDNFYLRDYVASLNRPFAYDDHTTLYKKLRKWEIMYTEDDTWFTTTNTLPSPREQINAFANLFGE